ncbi:hypothetical protein AO371_1913 [Moraxella catarrhalis]|nr:hypothetical protein AO380_0943 [Moraxella catarrhalis]OAV22325.1 hypothetical protein AO371_1913 [Moraxella catarrhalis]OAV30475.1 hypothetical protein AO367_1069 [Moraxella catarrhalis]
MGQRAVMAVKTAVSAILPCSQYCSKPCEQGEQVRQESTIQPTPTKSPTLNFWALSPTLAMRPMIS